MVQLDTLTYQYVLKSDRDSFYNNLIESQLQYFNQKNPHILSLDKGTSVNLKLSTKMQSIPVSAEMTVTSIIPNEIFELQTKTSTGTIIQTYQFGKTKRGENCVIYSEKNTYNKKRNQMNFIFVSFFYKFFYNRGIKKRMKYLDD